MAIFTRMLGLQPRSPPGLPASVYILMIILGFFRYFYFLFIEMTCTYLTDITILPSPDLVIVPNSSLEPNQKIIFILYFYIYTKMINNRARFFIW